MMKAKLITEFIGTFFLYLMISLSAVAGNAGDFAPLAIGIGLVAICFASGQRSKAHFNPAVTAAFLTTRNQPAKESLFYCIVTIAGAALAAYVALIITPAPFQAIIDNGTGLQHSENFELIPAILSEFLFTFALVWVILNVAIAKGTAGNEFYGIAIGFVVATGVFSVGSISGASFNPAVNVGLLIHQVIDLKLFVIYSVTQVFASLVATFIFNSIEPKSEANG
jgi:aquaporin Z